MYASDLKHSSPTLEDKLHQLYSLSRDKKIDLSFRPPYLQLLEKFGNPHLNLPPVIHVAGTNGKGSIIAMLRSILETAGYKVHAYTSPHLINFNERIVLAGEEITDDPLEDLIDEALAHNENNDITFFEITTAIAFAAFARTPADICLLEVGMGGRLDCTNVIEDPLVTIISQIGMDHTQHLGNTIEKIAGEKAGIMKPGAPCVIAPQSHNSALSIFKDKARSLDVSLFHANESLHDNALTGTHQQKNSAAALKTLELIAGQFPHTDADIEQGLKTVTWRARLQKLDAQRLGFGENWKIYLDGGHNAEAGQALAQEISSWNKPVHIICGMMQGKDAQAFLEPLIPCAETLSFVDIENEKQCQPAAELQKFYPNAECFENYKQALAHLKTIAPGHILICGSLYLAGHVLKDLQK